MKSVDVRTVVRIPISEVVGEIAVAHGIKIPLATARVDGDSIVLEFAHLGKGGSSNDVTNAGSSNLNLSAEAVTIGSSSTRHGHQTTALFGPKPRKRRTSRRNRMKTRGWNVIEKMVNSHGQTVTIYEPFVKALRGLAATRRNKEKVVSQILKGNGNRPGRESTRYYLDNTLEYLAKMASH